MSRLVSKRLVTKNMEFPQVFINSIPAPELTRTISLKKLSYYVNGLKELDLHDPDFIVMVCNSIHIYLDYLQKKIRSRILSVRKEVYSFVQSNRIESVCVLGTRSTIKNGLYNFEGVRYIRPNAAEINSLSLAIERFNVGIDRKKQIRMAKKIALNYAGKLGLLLAGCTEVALMLADTGIISLDPMDLLIDAAIKNIRGNKTYGERNIKRQ